MHCAGCGTGLPIPSAPASPRLPEPILRADELEPFFERSQTFTNADWPALAAYINQRFATLDHAEAYRDTVAIWASHIAEDFGGKYSVAQTAQFVCISELEQEHAARSIRFAEHAEESIRGWLHDVGWQNAANPLLVFITEADDYDAYVSQFYGEGTFAASIGVQIRHGYPQIVVHFLSWHEALTTLAHEMTHACVGHLPLPRWLDEGVAIMLQKQIGDVPPPESWSQMEAVWSVQSQWSPPVLSAEMAERHHAFWDEEKLQGFWAGTAFNEPGDASELSYSLAEILTQIITQDYANWRDFVARAQWGDAGQTAALDCFGAGLGEIAGTFLGEGEWRPVRKELVKHWRDAGWES